MLQENDILEEYQVNGVQVSTPSGYKDIKTVYKTKPLECIKIKTISKVLSCAKKHLIYMYGIGCVHAYTLQAGDLICTEDGVEPIISVKDIGYETCYDFTIDTEDGLYYTDGILSHNSTSLGAVNIVTSLSIPETKSLYIAPMPEMVKTFAYRYQEIESKCRVKVADNRVYHRKYDNKSEVRMLHVNTSAEQIRGMTVGRVMADEAQSIDSELVPEILYTQTNADLKSTLYAGTSLGMDTLLQKQWELSSQGVWMIKSETGKWIDTSDLETMWKIHSNKDYPIDPYTERKLDVSQGMYVHANQQALAEGFYGVHCPQVCIPDLANNPFKWNETYWKVRIDPPNKVINECFGLPVVDGYKEITEKDLVDLCVMDESEKELKRRAKSGYYKWVISGCDWGGSDYNPATKTKQSYTVHCIVGVSYVGAIDILYFKRYSGMEYESIVDDICRNYEEFNCNFIGTDFGVGMAYNTRIRKFINPERHIIFTYTGPKSSPMAVTKNSYLYNQYSINKTEAISRVYADIKKGPTKIKTRSWSEMSTYLQDFLNMTRCVSERPSGEKTFVYNISGTRPNDSLNAFNYAYVLARIALGERLIEEEGEAIQFNNNIAAGVIADANSGLQEGDAGFTVPDYFISG